jgi:UDP:flavonoid glycosyltransferase YjiC (YdhE family)
MAQGDGLLKNTEMRPRPKHALWWRGVTIWHFHLSSTNMSRVLLTTLGSLGDLHPLIAIGLELRQRGHTVWFCVGASFRTKIELLGFEFQPLRPDIKPENPAMAQVVKEIMDPIKGVERLLRGFLFPELRATYDDLMRAMASNGGADLFLSGELVYAAPLVAEKTGVRWASYTPAPFSFFSAYDPPVVPTCPKLALFLRAFGPHVNRLMLSLLKLITRAWSEPVRRLRTELGLKPGQDAIFEDRHSPELVLAIFSPTLADPQPDWPPNTVITGFPFYDGAAQGGSLAPALANFLAAGEPPIVFTLGSTAVLDPGPFYQASAEAARLLKRRAVLLVGLNPPPAPLPEDVVAFGYVRFSEIFARAAAIVHPGGIGTTGQALRAGCPMLVMPYSYDQPDNGARMVRLGVGHTISRKHYSAERAARELRKLLTDSKYGLAAAKISGRIQKEQGASVACDALERLLNTGDGEQRRP